MFALAVIILSLSFLSGVTFGLSPTAFVAMLPAGLVAALVLLAHWTGPVPQANLPVRQPLYWQILLLGGIIGSTSFGYWCSQIRSNSTVTTADSPALSTATEIGGVVTCEPVVLSSNRLELQVKAINASFPGRGWQPIQPAIVKIRITPAPTNQPRASSQTRFRELQEFTLYGDTIRTPVVWQVPSPPANPSSFNFPALLKEQGIAGIATAQLTELEILSRSRGSWLRECVYAVKHQFTRALAAQLSPSTRALACGTTLGLRAALRGVEFREEEITAAFQRAGLSHVLAVSGLHVGVITAVLAAGLRWLRVPRKLLPLIVCPLLLFFTLMTGAPPSAVRAALMCGVAITLYGLLGIRPGWAVVLGLAAALAALLLYNPWLLFSPSLLLSFGAVLALLLLTRPLTRWLKRWRGVNAFLLLLWFSVVLALANWRMSWLTQTPWPVLGLLAILPVVKQLGSTANRHWRALRRIGLGRCPRFLQDLGAAQLAVQLGAMIPLSAWFFGRYSVAGVLLNLVAIPLAGVLIPLAFATGLLGMLPPQLAWIAWPAAWLTEWCARAFLELAHCGSQFFAYPAIPKPSLATLGVYFAIVLALAFQRQLRALLPRRLPLRHRRLLAVGGPAGVFLLAVVGILAPRPPAPLMDITLFHREATPRQPAVPMLALTYRDRTATLLNPGNDYLASRVIFPALVGRQTVKLRSVWCGSTIPHWGLAGAAELAEAFPIQTCWTPSPAVPATQPSPLPRLFRSGCAVELLGSDHTPAIHSPTDHSLEWLPLPSHHNETTNGLIRLQWGQHRFLIVTDAALGSPARTGLTNHDLRAEVVILPGRTGSPRSPAQLNYLATLKQVLASAQPQLVVLTDGEESRFADTLAVCRSQSAPMILTTHLTGALTFAGHPSGDLFIVPFRPTTGIPAQVRLPAPALRERAEVLATHRSLPRSSRSSP